MYISAGTFSDTHLQKSLNEGLLLSHCQGLAFGDATALVVDIHAFHTGRDSVCCAAGSPVISAKTSVVTRAVASGGPERGTSKELAILAGSSGSGGSGMAVPLARFLAQQPPLATIIPLLDRSTTLDAQLAIVHALDGVDIRFRDQVLREFIRIIERTASDLAVAEELWEQYYALKTPAAIKALRSTGESEVRYDLPGGRSVAIRENRSTLVQAGETGHRTWESSLGLTEWLCVNAELRGIDQIIELGAGTGLVGLAAAKMGVAGSVLITDGSTQLMAKLERTVESNGLNGPVQTTDLRWEDTQKAATLPKGALVLAGDVLYGLHDVYTVLLDCLAALEPSRIILANPIRDPERYESFKELCRSRGIRVRVVCQYSASSVEETEWMFLVSIPPIRVELIELELP